MKTIRLLVPVFLMLCLGASSTVLAQAWVDADRTIEIDPSRGVDRRVDYRALVEIGPWDDRNYHLKAEDLELLADNEREITQRLPVFFRVFMRRSFLKRGIETLYLYPLSAFNEFRQNHGGYLIDGKYYRRALYREDRFVVDLNSEVQPIEVPVEPQGGGSLEARVTFPTGAAESAIAISPADTQKLVAGSNGPLGGQRMHYSDDGGESWTQVNLPFGGTCCDPTVEWSSDGAFAYAGTLGACSGGCDLWFYRSDNNGLTWDGLGNVTPGDVRREIASSADREFLHVDQSSTSPFLDRIYITWHNANIMRLSRSADFGDTWSTFTFSGSSIERGIAGDVVTDRSGKVYFVWPAFTSKTIRLRTSTDGGVNFDATEVISTTKAAFSFPIPAEESREVAVYVSGDADLSNGPFADSIYLVWPDSTSNESSNPSQNHAWLRVAATHDGGDTWTITTPHETDDLNTVDRWQSFIAVGPDGTVHLIFNDTRNSTNRTAADIYYTFSVDGAATWSTPERVTTEMSPNINNGFEFGDYSGLDIVMNDLVAIFTDNRNETGGSGESVDVYSAKIPAGVANTAGGVPSSRHVPGQPMVLDTDGADVILDWADACGPHTDYAVYVGTIGDFETKTRRKCSTNGDTFTSLPLGTGDLFYLVTATSDTVEGTYGESSNGSQRTPAASPCLPQVIEPCSE